MKDQDFIEAAKKLIEDRETLCNALGISNPHNAKQALTKLNRRVEELEDIVQSFVDAAGADNWGNALKRVRTAFGVQDSRIVWMAAAPHSWVGKVPSSRHESLLNRLSRKVQHLLSLIHDPAERPEWERDLLYDFQTKDYQQFATKLDGLLASVVHGVPVSSTKEESASTGWVNFADQLDSIFVTSYLSPVAIESLRAASASSPGGHISSERFAQMTEQETAVPSRAGQTAFTIAKVLCAESIFGEVPIPGSDEDVAFQGVVDDQDAFFSVLNEGGVDRVTDLVSEALLALEQESLASQ